MAKAKTVEQLQEENLELKLSDIRKDIRGVEKNLDDRLARMETILDQVLDHAKLTNGSVANVKERVIVLESNDCSKTLSLEQLSKETEDLRWIVKHPKLLKSIVVIFILIILYTGGVDLINILKSLLVL